MKKMMILAVPMLALACGDSGTTPPAQDMAMPAQNDMTMPSNPDMTPPGPPPAPTLGAQIDRIGRPGVNTALTDPFDNAQGMTQDMVKDAYNAAADPTKWTTMFTGSGASHTGIAGNLAIFDGLDTNCGNQIGADLAMPRYSYLGAFLANDALLLDSSQTTCNLYLGVEAHALLGAPADCGGRTPTEDVIDETYSLLATGMPTGLSDGVDKDGDNPPTSTFPFLGMPN